VGNRLRLHTIPAFISIIGGLVLFGAPGFILGPLAATMTMLLVQFWTRDAGADQGGKHG
jgi:predicted PurR-regulated permease PerM